MPMTPEQRARLINGLAYGGAGAALGVGHELSKRYGVTAPDMISRNTSTLPAALLRGLLYAAPAAAFGVGLSQLPHGSIADSPLFKKRAADSVSAGFLKAADARGLEKVALLPALIPALGMGFKALSAGMAGYGAYKGVKGTVQAGAHAASGDWDRAKKSLGRAALDAGEGALWITGVGMLPRLGKLGKLGGWLRGRGAGQAYSRFRRNPVVRRTMMPPSQQLGLKWSRGKTLPGKIGKSAAGTVADFAPWAGFPLIEAGRRRLEGPVHAFPSRAVREQARQQNLRRMQYLAGLGLVRSG